MKKIVTIIGARPQIIKSSAISRAVRKKYMNDFQEVIVHTGQHYDENMSEVFFEELSIPRPNYNLNVGSGKHGEQTASMINGIEEILIKENPDFIILYGDTNSTLAGAIAASKIHIPIVHIEAGLRSYNKKMPEEINRILADHSSTYLFPPTQAGLDNLIKEGFSITNSTPYSMDNPCIANVGDVMYDNSMYFSKVADKQSEIISTLDLEPENYILCTIHRNNNTDNPKHLEEIFLALDTIAHQNNIDIILPLHPRTKNKLDTANSSLISKSLRNPRIKLIEPVPFLDMISLEKNSKLIITDSGGVQKEAYFFKKPCLILRNETEWIEILNSNAAYLCGHNSTNILEGYQKIMDQETFEYQPYYGSADASERILETLLD